MQETKAWRRELTDPELGEVGQYVIAHEGRILGFETYDDDEMSQVVVLDSEDEIPADFDVVPIRETGALLERLRSRQPATA